MARTNRVDLLYRTPRPRHQAGGRGRLHVAPSRDRVPIPGIWVRIRPSAGHALQGFAVHTGRPIPGYPRELVSVHKQKGHHPAIGSRYKAGCSGGVPARCPFRLTCSGVPHAPSRQAVHERTRPTGHFRSSYMCSACVYSARVGHWGGKNTWVRLRARRTFGTVPRDTDNGVDPAWERRGGQRADGPRQVALRWLSGRKLWSSRDLIRRLG